MGLTNKQRAFIAEYLRDFNATRAAAAVGYAHPNMAGPRLIVKDGIRAAIEQAITERIMGPDEVKLRLADIARGDMGELLDINSMSFGLDLEAAKEKGLTKLIKKIRQTTTYSSKGGEDTERTVIDLELYDAQAALVHIGKHLRLFDENVTLRATVDNFAEFDEAVDRIYESKSGSVHPSSD